MPNKAGIMGYNEKEARIVKHRKTWLWVFAVYCALMAWLLFGRERFDAPMGYWQQVADNINPRPFETIIRLMGFLIYDYSDGLKRHAIINLVGNVIMFVPLGFLPALLLRQFRPLWKCMMWGGVIIVCVELTQLFALVGSCDFDDLLLNLVGIGLGYGLYRAVERRSQDAGC